MISIHHMLPRDDAALGLIRAEGLEVGQVPPGFEEALTALLSTRAAPLSDADEAVRKAARDLLRNGRYKPKGRGKPASEYLLRAAQPDASSATPPSATPNVFPRISAPVDVANFMSLKTVLPISLWDLDRAGTTRFQFRLGRPGEAYVFNTAGQTIGLEDLIVGCRVTDGEEVGEPVVNPVKDSLATKTTAQTQRVAACIYTPLAAVSPEALEALCAELAGLLAGCGEAVEVAHAVVQAGEVRRM